MSLLSKHIPSQHIGSKTGATAKCHTFRSEEAQLLFDKAKERLLAINKWYELCEKKGAEFHLTDSKGIKLNSSIPEIGNLIRIKLPAPRNSKGDGFDWVRIEKFETDKNAYTDEELFGFRVRPIKNPNENSQDSAHFYTSDATSSFLLYRHCATVYALERGRNEVPNPKGTFSNKIRNFIVALTAMLGLSKPQWKRLVNGLLYTKNDKSE